MMSSNTDSTVTISIQQARGIESWGGWEKFGKSVNWLKNCMIMKDERIMGNFLRSQKYFSLSILGIHYFRITMELNI